MCYVTSRESIKSVIDLNVINKTSRVTGTLPARRNETRSVALGKSVPAETPIYACFLWDAIVLNLLKLWLALQPNCCKSPFSPRSKTFTCQPPGTASPRVTASLHLWHILLQNLIATLRTFYITSLMDGDLDSSYVEVTAPLCMCSSSPIRLTVYSALY